MSDSVSPEPNAAVTVGRHKMFFHVDPPSGGTPFQLVLTGYVASGADVDALKARLGETIEEEFGEGVVVEAMVINVGEAPWAAK